MRCFVIMPFGDGQVDREAAARSHSLYEKWIKKCVETIPDPDAEGRTIQCSRADKHHKMGDVIEHIVEDLVEADVVIADLSGRNANVFYELGVRHAISTGTILIAQSEDDIPFDLRRQRTFFYRYEPDSLLELQESIRGAVLEIARDRSRIDSSVRRYLYERETKKIAERGNLPGYDVVRDILSEISRMRTDFTRELGSFRALVSAAAPGETVAADPSLSDLQGIWFREDGSGCYCSRIVNGELRVPYCFSGKDRIDSHFWDVRLVNRLLFAKFSWLKQPMSGNVMFRVESLNRLVGGWWFDDENPPTMEWALEHASSLLTTPRLLRPLVLVRQPASTQVPTWAEDYFAKQKQRLGSTR